MLCCDIAEEFMSNLIVSWTFNQTLNVKSDNQFWVPSWRLQGPAIPQCGLLYIMLSFICSEHSHHCCLFAATCTQSFCEFREWKIHCPSSEIGFKWLPQFHKSFSKNVISSVFIVTSIPLIASRLFCNKSGRVLMRKQSHSLHSFEKWGVTFLIFTNTKYRSLNFVCVIPHD